MYMFDYWGWLSRSMDVMSLVTLGFSGYTFWRVRQYHKWMTHRIYHESGMSGENFERTVREHEGIQTEKPVALVISIAKEVASIQEDVRRFLEIKKWHMPIEVITSPGLYTMQDLENFRNALLEKKYSFDYHYTEVHLFMAGPVIAATIVGAVFDMWKPVKLYHKPTPTPPHIYEYWMPLM